VTKQQKTQTYLLLRNLNQGLSLYGFSFYFLASITVEILLVGDTDEGEIHLKRLQRKAEISSNNCMLKNTTNL
jgi:hypothetical protein